MTSSNRPGEPRSLLRVPRFWLPSCRAVTLPARSFLHAEVAPTFRWKYADNPTRTDTVPEGNTGLDVLFRE